MSMTVALSLKEQNSKRNKIVLTVLAVFVSFLAIVFLAIGFYFYSQKSMLEKKFTSSLNLFAGVVTSEFDEDFKFLNVVANLIVENPEFASVENVATMFETIPSNTSRDFSTVSYLNKSGAGYTYNYDEASLSTQDLSTEKCFSKALSQPMCMDYNAETNSIVMAVPTFVDREATGVILGTKKTGYLDNYFRSFKTICQGDLFLVNTNGTIVNKFVKFTDAKDSVYQLPSLKEKNIKFGSNSNNYKFFWDFSHRNVTIVSPLILDTFSLVFVGNNVSFFNHKFINGINLIKSSKLFNSTIILSILILIAVSIFVFSLGFVIKALCKKSGGTLLKWAMHDDVTGGYNKSKFVLEVSQKILNSKPDDKFSMIIMDIENFKLVNQIYDTVKGNEVLKKLYESINWFLEKNGICARIMSDYFAIFFTGKDDEKLISFINNLTRTISEYKLSIRLNPRFGIYNITDYSIEVDAMIDRALMAVKTLNDNSTSNYAFFTNSILDEINNSKEIENEMYYALNQNQFLIYLQPQIDVLTKDLTGAEALVRWQHPEKGLLTPDKFLSLFKKNAFVTYLDQYVVEQVCKLIGKWISFGLEPLPISVNISNLDLSNPRFADMMKSMTEMYNVSTKYICFDIDEDVIFENYKIAFSTISSLKSYGFGVNLDNFGKRYSATNLFNNFAFDSVKFNKDFLKNLIKTDKGKNILTGLKQLVNSIYAKAVAIGIENENDFNFMKQAEFDSLQGFVFSKPIDIIEFENLVYKKTITNDEETDNDKNMDL